MGGLKKRVHKVGSRKRRSNVLSENVRLFQDRYIGGKLQYNSSVYSEVIRYYIQRQERGGFGAF